MSSSVGEAAVVIELNPRERRLYDRLRDSVVRPEIGAGSGLRDLLLLLPDMAVLLIRLMRDPRVPAGSKAVGFLALAYLFSPIDLVPEIFLGPFGLVDDLLVIGTALSRLLNHVHPDVVRSHWSGRGDALEAIQRVTGWTEDNVTGRLKGAVRRLIG